MNVSGKCVRACIMSSVSKQRGTGHHENLRTKTGSTSSSETAAEIRAVAKSDGRGVIAIISTNQRRNQTRNSRAFGVPCTPRFFVRI